MYLSLAVCLSLSLHGAALLVTLTVLPQLSGQWMSSVNLRDVMRIHDLGGRKFSIATRVKFGACVCLFACLFVCLCACVLVCLLACVLVCLAASSFFMRALCLGKCVHAGKSKYFDMTLEAASAAAKTKVSSQERKTHTLTHTHTHSHTLTHTHTHTHTYHVTLLAMHCSGSMPL